MDRSGTSSRRRMLAVERIFAPSRLGKQHLARAYEQLVPIRHQVVGADHGLSELTQRECRNVGVSA
jgi:hypothetical protein